MVNDRGSKKWSSLMLPEQVSALKQLWEEKENKTKPELDRQQIGENEYMLQKAIQSDAVIKLTYFSKDNYQTASGKIGNVKQDRLLVNGVDIAFQDIVLVDII